MIRFPRCRPAAALACFASFLAAGCGGGDYPETVAVSGTVTLDGEPVPEAVVTFLPTDGRRAATGYTDASGRFSLTTFEPGDGAVPGAHQVAVNPTEPPPMPGDTAVMGGAKPTSPKAYRPSFPAKYGNPKESGLTAEVSPDGDSEFTFEMKS